MADYIRYHQSKRLRDKSSLFLLSAFVLIVVYTSVIGFVLVHVLKITKSVEDNNNELARTNKKLEDRLEELVLRLERVEAWNSSDIGLAKRVETEKITKKTREHEMGAFQEGLENNRQDRNQNSVNSRRNSKYLWRIKRHKYAD